MSMLDNPRAVLGNNSPPSPLQLASERINSLFDEAKNWLDGETIEDEKTADGVAQLLRLMTDAEKEAKAAHDVEKAPHLAACRAVDTAYKPILTMADQAKKACSAALTPWLLRVEEENRQRAAEERRRADEALAAATAAIRSSHQTNLTEIETAEEALAAAKRLDRRAGRAEREKAAAGSGFRAVALRTKHVAFMDDPGAALTHYRLTEPKLVKEFLQSLADRDVRAGKRSIPGFRVEEQRSAV